MADLKYTLLEGDIGTALKLCNWVKTLKVILAFLILLSYFFFPGLLLDVIVVSLIISLLLPLGFFDVFMQKLLEYNTQKVEERQLLNASEANEHFEKIYKKISGLYKKVGN